jgi:hypothetical protein
MVECIGVTHHIQLDNWHGVMLAYGFSKVTGPISPEVRNGASAV